MSIMSFWELRLQKWEATCWNRIRGHMSRSKTISLCVLMLLLSDFVVLPRWYKDISSRPVWLAIKDVDVASTLTYQ